VEREWAWAWAWVWVGCSTTCCTECSHIIAISTDAHSFSLTIAPLQARQRASVKWLLSKAFNNRVPDNLKEPFYRDHENQERLKPQIIVELGNATLYCQTLANLYSDPNYQSMNHWSIIQTLARKGVPVAESADMPITETVLIQTNPLRIVSRS